MQPSAQEVTMLFKLIAAAKDSWACLNKQTLKILFYITINVFYDMTIENRTHLVSIFDWAHAGHIHRLCMVCLFNKEISLDTDIEKHMITNSDLSFVEGLIVVKFHDITVEKVILIPKKT